MATRKRRTPHLPQPDLRGVLARRPIPEYPARGLHASEYLNARNSAAEEIQLVYGVDRLDIMSDAAREAISAVSAFFDHQLLRHRNQHSLRLVSAALQNLREFLRVEVGPVQQRTKA